MYIYIYVYIYMTRAMYTGEKAREKSSRETKEKARGKSYVKSESEALHTSLCRIVACGMPHYRA